MPRNKNTPQHLHECSVEERSKHSHTCQIFWYEFVKQWCTDRRVLDVGAGRGDGMEILRPICRRIIGIDPLPMGPKVRKSTLNDFLGNHSGDDGHNHVVLAMDVIEHIENAYTFFKQLCKLSTDKVFFSTPNYNVHQCRNQFHIREYTPMELKNFLQGYKYRVFEADSNRDIKEVDKFEDESLANDFGVLVNI